MHEGFGPQLIKLSWPILYFIIMHLSTNFIFFLCLTKYIFSFLRNLFHLSFFSCVPILPPNFSHATVVTPSEFAAISILIICHFLDISSLWSSTKPSVSSPLIYAHHFNWVSFLFLFWPSFYSSVSHLVQIQKKIKMFVIVMLNENWNHSQHNRANSSTSCGTN